MRKIVILAAVASILVFAGCASQRPVLYPNAKLKQVGEAAARRDVDDCIQQAEAYGAKHGGGERAARQGAGGAVIGGVTGAVAGAVGGGRVAERAVQGAAVGGAAGSTHGAIHSDEPGALHKNFVSRCLRDRGYEVIGWQ